jgi:lysophospholipase L1-like esterase
MKNYRSNVLLFIYSIFIILISFSYFAGEVISFYPNFKSINILSDIVSKTSVKRKHKVIKVVKPIKNDIAFDTVYNLDDYSIGNSLINPWAEDKLSLIKLQKKINQLSKNKNVKIRIAWFGDSVIEGDLVTQQLRELFSNYFKSDIGVGFLPINTVSSQYRLTGTVNTKGDYETNNFKKNPFNLYLSGYSYKTSNLELTVHDGVKKNPSQNLQKWLYCGKGDSLEIEFNNQIKKMDVSNHLNKILIDNSPSKTIKFKLINSSSPLYGVSLEPESGIIIDNFSFRGITGVELKKINDNLLNDINEIESYDLIVFQYGVNLLFSPNLNNFDYYYTLMNPVIKKIKKRLPNSELLIIGSADRAFKYEGEWKTAIGMDSLIKTQSKLAFDNRIPFINLYKSMGGQGTIVKWADSKPSLANKDYVHFNRRGADEVAKIIFNSIIKDYKTNNKTKYTK